MRVSALILAVIVIVGLGFLGYVVYGEYVAARNVEVEIVDVSIEQVGLASSVLSIKLKFANPTGYETPVFWVDSYSIYVNGKYVGSGSLPQTRIPASSTIYATTKVTLEHARVGEGVVSAIRAGKFTLTIEGVIEAKILFGIIPIPGIPFSATYTYG